MKRRVDAQQLAALLVSSRVVQKHFPYAGSASVRLPGRPYRYGYEAVTPEYLARQLIAEEELAGIRLGAWLGTREGALIEEAVGMIIPTAYREDYSLLVRALRIAAQKQNKKMAGLALAGGGLGALLIWLSRG